MWTMPRRIVPPPICKYATSPLNTKLMLHYASTCISFYREKAWFVTQNARIPLPFHRPCCFCGLLITHRLWRCHGAIFQRAMCEMTGFIMGSSAQTGCAGTLTQSEHVIFLSLLSCDKFNWFFLLPAWKLGDGVMAGFVSAAPCKYILTAEDSAVRGNDRRITTIHTCCIATTGC